MSWELETDKFRLHALWRRGYRVFERLLLRSVSCRLLYESESVWSLMQGWKIGFKN